MFEIKDVKMMNWKVFIVTHGPIREEYYVNDPDFSYEHFVLFNVSDSIMTHNRFEVINAKTVEGYKSLGKWYAEAEAIYNVYICGLYTGLNYIGFIHWDYELKSEQKTIGYSISRHIENAIHNSVDFISFSTFDFKYAYNLNIMLDATYPNQCYGTEGKNCLDVILEQYNIFYGQSLTRNMLMNGKINLCSAHMVSKTVFEEMMSFYVYIIDSGFLDQFDTNHKYRFQRGMMERYLGVCSTQYRIMELPLYLHYKHKKEASTIELQIEKLKKILSSIIKSLK